MHGLWNWGCYEHIQRKLKMSKIDPKVRSILALKNRIGDAINLLENLFLTTITARESMGGTFEHTPQFEELLSAIDHNTGRLFILCSQIQDAFKEVKKNV